MEVRFELRDSHGSLRERLIIAKFVASEQVDEAFSCVERASITRRALNTNFLLLIRTVPTMSHHPSGAAPGHQVNFEEMAPHSNKEPVNFGRQDSISRRVTLGGSQEDRRGSLASVNMNLSMDDFFNRRGSLGMGMDFAMRRNSMGFDINTMDPLFSQQTRRDSIDNMGGFDTSLFNDFGRRRMSNFGGPSGSTDMMFHQPGDISLRQQQLQQQQRELEQRQRELEIQRQQLLASMKERNFSLGMGNMGPITHNPSLGMGSTGFGSLGLGTSMRSVNSNVISGPGGGNWWICQVCNSQAFATQEEASRHEEICQAGPRPTDYGNLGSMPMGNMSEMSNYSHGALGMSTASRHSYLDSSSNTAYEHIPFSTGPFAQIEKPITLAMPTDAEWLTPLHCFVREQCVEVFTASEGDVAHPSKGKRKPIQVGQVGIRCAHCHDDTNKARERGSVYYPTSIASVYNATMNLLQRHLHTCTAVPDEIMRKYESLKADDARSGTSKKYWMQSAASLGLVDTPSGIRFSALPPPPLPTLSPDQLGTSSQSIHSLSHRGGDEKMPAQSSFTEQQYEALDRSGPLVTEEDRPYATAFSFELMEQMFPCTFTEADRLGKRKGLPPGFPGLACKHCFGGFGSGRFFPSSIKTLSDTSKTLNVLHNHMMRCRKCPVPIRDSLEQLRGTHDEERSKMKFGSQKAFFARIWDRLHGKDAPPSMRGGQNDGHRAKKRKTEEQDD